MIGWFFFFFDEEAPPIKEWQLKGVVAGRHQRIHIWRDGALLCGSPSAIKGDVHGTSIYHITCKRCKEIHCSAEHEKKPVHQVPTFDPSVAEWLDKLIRRGRVVRYVERRRGKKEAYRLIDGGTERRFHDDNYFEVIAYKLRLSFSSGHDWWDVLVRFQDGHYQNLCLDTAGEDRKQLRSGSVHPAGRETDLKVLAFRSAEARKMFAAAPIDADGFVRPPRKG